ncbi:MAG: tetraacyldisaccharide 4'-kinase [Pseudomonadota bacterium]
MKAPGFWFRPPGIAAASLAPFAALHATVTRRRVARPPVFSPAVPVVCVGNINVGGTGKTPIVIELIKRLQRSGRVAHVVSRGYGGKISGPARVDARRHSARDVGDEPLLLSAFAPTFIGRDRAAAAGLAADGADVLLLDDGFQNPALRKDANLIAVDAARGFGNGRVFPAGPLREPLSAGFRRADLLLSIGPTQAQDAFRETLPPAAPELVKGRLEPLRTGMDWNGLPVLAFAGIGHPEKFFATLRELGADVRHAEALGDHQPLTPGLMRRLENKAHRVCAQLVTTEKDAVRLPAGFRPKVLTVPVRLRLEEWRAVDALLGRLGLI